MPSAGAVRVSDPRVVLTFSEPVEEASVRRALSISPAPALAPEVRVRGRDAEIVIPNGLRPDITYVVTIGTELRDLRGVAVTAPITLAFATGDRIDEGRIAGVVRDPATGGPAHGVSVLAYHLGADPGNPPNPAAEAADYRTQSGSDGTFELGYLRAGAYFVIALVDRNRDGLAGAGEVFAAPQERAVAAADTGRVPVVALSLAAADTTGPSLRTVRAVDIVTVAARFDEPVRPTPGRLRDFVVEDSADGRSVEIQGVWSASDSRELLLATEPLTRDRVYRLRLSRPGSVADSIGNPAATGAVSFRGPSSSERPTARFEQFLPEARVERDSAYALLPGEGPGIRFSRPISREAAAARVTVLDDARASIPFQTLMGDVTTLSVHPDSPSFTIVVDDTANTRHYRQASIDELGGVVGRVVGGSEGTTRLYLTLEGGPRGATREATALPSGHFLIAGLLPGSYRVRVHFDTDGDGVWDGGRLFPHVPPEPIGWLPGPVRVRARWESDLGDVRLENGGASSDGVEVDEQQDQ